MKDKFTIWIKNIINKSEVKPPAQVWENISKDLDIQSSWKSVDRQLDLDKVWSGVSAQLHEDTRVRQIEQIAYAAPLLALLMSLAIGWIQFDTDTSAKETKQIVLNEISVDSLSSVVDSSLNLKENIEANRNVTISADRIDKSPQESTLAKVKKSEKPVIENYSRTKQEVISIAKQENDESQELLFSPIDLNPIDKLVSNDINWEYLALSAPNIHLTLKDEVFIENKKSQNSWYVGAGAFGGIGTITNNRTIRAAEMNESAQVVSPANSYAVIQLGYMGNEKWGIHGNFVVFGQVNQQFGEYNNGRFVKGDNRISYHGIQLGAKRTFYLEKFLGLKTSIIAGPYFNFISQVEESKTIFIDNVNLSQDLTGAFKQLDYGLWLGYELEYPISKQMSFGTQINWRASINNIYKGEVGVPAYLRDTRTSEIGAIFFIRKKL